MRAVDAAINSRQWNKAVQILSVAGDSDGALRYYVKIAKHFASAGELEKAEQFFVGAGATEEAIKMYNEAGKWEEAHRVSEWIFISRRNTFKHPLIPDNDRDNLPPSKPTTCFFVRRRRVYTLADTFAPT